MRIIVLFDLPVKKKKDRKIYAQFRKLLVGLGFDMIQFSVYSKFCNGFESVQRAMTVIERYTPTRGSVRVLTLTDKQYGGMKILAGNHTLTEVHVGSKQLCIF